MAELVVLYWRDIPSQVVASAGRRNQAKVLLPDRFQQAIDRAAMRGKAADTDSYLADWRRAPPCPCDDDLATAAAAEAARLDSAYDPARLATLVAAGGRETPPKG